MNKLNNYLTPFIFMQILNKLTPPYRKENDGSASLIILFDPPEEDFLTLRQKPEQLPKNPSKPGTKRGVYLVSKDVKQFLEFFMTSFTLYDPKSKKYVEIENIYIGNRLTMRDLLLKFRLVNPVSLDFYNFFKDYFIDPRQLQRDIENFKKLFSEEEISYIFGDIPNLENLIYSNLRKVKENLEKGEELLKKWYLYTLGDLERDQKFKQMFDLDNSRSLFSGKYRKNMTLEKYLEMKEILEKFNILEKYYLNCSELEIVCKLQDQEEFAKFLTIWADNVPAEYDYLLQENFSLQIDRAKGAN